MTTTQPAEKISTRFLTAGIVILNGSIPVTITEITQVAPNRYSFTWVACGQTQTESYVHGSKTWIRKSWGE